MTTTRTTIGGTAAALLALLLTTAACGSASPPAQDLNGLSNEPAPPARIYPPTELPSPAPSERAERADALRAAQGHSAPPTRIIDPGRRIPDEAP